MPTESLMDVQQVAALLNVSASTVYAWAQQAKVPAYKLGRTWRFRRDDIEAWQSQRAPSDAPETTQKRPSATDERLDESHL